VTSPTSSRAPPLLPPLIGCDALSWQPLSGYGTLIWQLLSGSDALSWQSLIGCDAMSWKSLSNEPPLPPPTLSMIDRDVLL
jgi:hypothetical protein